MQDDKIVTVITATQNNADTIERAILSVISGNRPANKVIIGDNDSTDGTYDKLCELLGAESVTIDGQTGLPPKFDGTLHGVPVTIFRQRKNTIANTMNVAMRMNNRPTNIFGFLDPTSWYEENKIQRSLDIFNKHSYVACVVNDYIQHGRNGLKTRLFLSSFDAQRLLSEFTYDLNFMIRIEALIKLRSAFNDNIQKSEAYDLLLRISNVGLIYHIPEPLHNNLVVDLDDSEKEFIQAQENLIRRSIIEQNRNNNG